MWTLELVELCGRWMPSTHVRNFQVLQVAITKLQTGEMVEGQGRFRARFLSVWGPQLHMTGEKTSVHKTTVECWRRYRQRTRALVGRKRWLHHSKRTHQF